MTELASKSMTAVTSVVSVVKEETVIALRCNTRGTEQIALPLVAIPIMVIAIILLCVGVALPFWVEVSLQKLILQTEWGDLAGQKCRKYISVADCSCAVLSTSHIEPLCAYSARLSFIELQPQV